MKDAEIVNRVLRRVTASFDYYLEYPMLLKALLRNIQESGNLHIPELEDATEEYFPITDGKNYIWAVIDKGQVISFQARGLSAGNDPEKILTELGVSYFTDEDITGMGE